MQWLPLGGPSPAYGWEPLRDLRNRGCPYFVPLSRPGRPRTPIVITQWLPRASCSRTYIRGRFAVDGNHCMITRGTKGRALLGRESRVVRTRRDHAIVPG